MKQFYETYAGNEKVSSLVTQLSWTNYASPIIHDFIPLYFDLRSPGKSALTPPESNSCHRVSL